MSYMWICHQKSRVDLVHRTAFFIANTKEQVVEMMEYHWIRTYLDSEKNLKKYPMDNFNITNFKELRKEKFWLVFTSKDNGTPEDTNTHYSDILICNKKENVLKLYRSLNEINDSVPDDAYDFIEMVPMERYWGIYNKSQGNESDDSDAFSMCLNIVTGETKEEALDKHMKEKGISDASLYDACEEMPERKNFKSWE